MVDHAGATSAVTFKAAAQTGVSIAVGEKAFVYYNGTDYVKVASSLGGVSTITFGSTGLTPSTATSGAVSVAGTLVVTNGGTGLSTTTPYGVVFAGTTATGPFQAAAGPGTATHVLTSNGASALPTFQALPASVITAGQSIAFALIFGL
jgi:hypothetical protein